MGLDHRWPEVSQAYADVNQPVRRHRQGDADVEGGRRHGAVHGRQRPDAGRRAGPGARGRVPRIGGVAVPRRAGLPAGRLSRGAVAQGPQGGTPRPSAGAARALSPGDTLPPVDLEAARQEAEKAAGHQISRQRPRLLPDVPEGVPRVRRPPSPLRRRQHAADAGLLLRPARARGDRGRHRSGQDAGDPAAGRRADDEEGVVKVFFELNGQPRTMRVEKAGAAKAARRMQAEPAMPPTSPHRCPAWW